jgi:hypothetical protein
LLLCRNDGFLPSFGSSDEMIQMWQVNRRRTDSNWWQQLTWPKGELKCQLYK